MHILSILILASSLLKWTDAQRFERGDNLVIEPERRFFDSSSAIFVQPASSKGELPSSSSKAAPLPPPPPTPPPQSSKAAPPTPPPQSSKASPPSRPPHQNPIYRHQRRVVTYGCFDCPHGYVRQRGQVSQKGHVTYTCGRCVPLYLPPVVTPCDPGFVVISNRCQLIHTWVIPPRQYCPGCYCSGYTCPCDQCHRQLGHGSSSAGHWSRSYGKY